MLPCPAVLCRLVPVYLLVLLLYGIKEAVRQGLHGDRLPGTYPGLSDAPARSDPGQILEGSANAFCHPAWELPVEWQFWGSPVVFVAPPPIVNGCVSASVMASMAVSALLVRAATFPFQATVVMRVVMFGVGIASLYILSHGDGARYAHGAIRGLSAPRECRPALGLARRGPHHGRGSLDPSLAVSILTHHASIETWPTLLVCRFLSLPFVVWL